MYIFNNKSALVAVRCELIISLRLELTPLSIIKITSTQI